MRLISKLPKDIKEKALANQKACKNDEQHSKTTDLIESAFDWFKAKEGFDFWADVFNAHTERHFELIRDTYNL